MIRYKMFEREITSGEHRSYHVCVNNFGSNFNSKSKFYPIDEAQKQTLEFLSLHTEAGRSPLCGNTISHDRRFLRRYMPKLDAFFHYRNVDVSSIKELIKRWNPELLEGFRKSGGHRAMEDVLESIEELKFYRDKFFI